MLFVLGFTYAVSRVFRGARRDNNSNAYKDSSGNSLLPSAESTCASGDVNVYNSDNERVRSDETNDQDDSESPTIPFKLTDPWKSCILAQAFNSCLPAFIQDLVSVMEIADCLYSKYVFSKDDTDHVRAISEREGVTSGCRELLRRVVRTSCYADFLDSLQSKEVSQEDLHKQLSKEYSSRLQLPRVDIIEQMKDYIDEKWEPRKPIERSIGAISEICEHEMSVSEELMETLHLLGTVNDAEKNKVLHQVGRKEKVQRLLSCLLQTSKFVQLMYIISQVRAFADLKKAIYDYLLRVRVAGEQLEDIRLISDGQRWAAIDARMQVDVDGNEMLKQLARVIFKDGLPDNVVDIKEWLWEEFMCLLLKAKDGSIILELEFRSVQGLLRFWLEYINGSLKAKLSKYVLKLELYRALEGAEFNLSLEIDESELLHALKVLINRQVNEKTWHAHPTTGHIDTSSADVRTHSTTGHIDTSSADLPVNMGIKTTAKRQKPRNNKYRDFLLMCDTVEVQQLLCPYDDDEDDDMEVDIDWTTLDEFQTEPTLSAAPTPGLSAMDSSLLMVTSVTQDGTEDDKGEWQQLCDRVRDILQDKVSQVVISNVLDAFVAHHPSHAASTNLHLEINPQHNNTMISFRDELATGADNVTVAQKVQSMFSSLDSDSDSLTVLPESTAVLGKLSDLEELTRKPESVVDDAMVDNELLDSQQWTRLHTAVIEINVERVKDLVKAGVSVNVQDKDGMTALHHAAHRRSVEIIQHLLSAGASVDIKAQDGMTALHLAALLRSVEMVQQLLSAGASVDVKAQDGKTALHNAAQVGSVEAVQELLSAGASVDLKGQDGMTALLHAVQEGSVEMVQELLSARASVDIKAEDGMTALLHAVQEGSVEMVQELLSARASVDIKAERMLIIWRRESVILDKPYVKQNGMTALLYAASRGLEKIVQELLSAGASVDIKAQDGMTALLHAVRQGSVEIVQELLSARASVDIKAEDGMTALLHAVRQGSVEIVQELLSARASVDIKAENGMTALHLAARRGSVEMVQHLLSAGASVDFKAQDGMTALLHAAQSGSVETVQHLLSAGASVDIKAEDGMTALLYAAQRGSVEMVQHLLRAGASVDFKAQDGMTALHHAIWRGSVEMVQQLLSAGTSVDIKAQDGMTALHHAVRLGSVEMVQQLLIAGASVDIKAEDGMTALLYAAPRGSVEMVQHLLSAGASVDFKAQDGMTALLHAAQSASVETVQHLLSTGASVDIKAENGMTALLYAAQRGSVEMVQHLLSAGASVDFKAQDGMTALLHAVRLGSVEMVKHLLSAGASVDIKVQDGMTALLHAVREGSVEMVQVLLSARASVDIKAEDGMTALLHAVQEGSVEMVQELLSARASVDIKAEDGMTALLHAVQEGSVEMVQELLSARASVDIKAEDGMTALLHAARLGSVKMAQHLLSAGASVDIKARNGYTALHFAAQIRHTRIIEELLKHGASVDVQTQDCESLMLMTIRSRINIVDLKLTIRLLLRAGYTNRTDLAWMSTHELPTELDSDPELLSWLRKQLDAVPTLQHLCRVPLREYINRSTGASPGASWMEEKIDAFSIPKTVKNFLLLRHLKEPPS